MMYMLKMCNLDEVMNKKWMTINDDMTVYLIDSCISIKYYDVYSHPFIVVVIFMVFVLMGYKYSGWGALVAGHIRGGDGDLIPLILFSYLM